MRYLKTFEQYQINEWWNPQTWFSRKKSNDKSGETNWDFSYLSGNSIKDEFLTVDEIKKIINKKINEMKSDPLYLDIMKKIRQDEFINAKIYLNQNQNHIIEIELNDNRTITLGVERTNRYQSDWIFFAYIKIPDGQNEIVGYIPIEDYLLVKDKVSMKNKNV